MSKIRVAINGFGRIGRHAFKIAWANKNIEIVAFNNPGETKTFAHLLKYDTSYPEFKPKISYDDKHIIVNGKKIIALSEREPNKLPWRELKIDVVIESTGKFRDKEGAGLHLQAGAKKVVISAPAKGEGIQSFVCGVNSKSYANQQIIDAASCTTNCAVPVIDVMHKIFGIEKGMITTVHAYTADQNLQDGDHRDLRRARAAAQNIIPTSTGAASAVTKTMPALSGKMDGLSLRVPVITGSLTDFTLLLKKNTTKEHINTALIKASKTYLKGVLAVTDEPLVSSDFIGNPHSSIADLSLTDVVDGNLVKVIAWYDNEWGYANRLVEMVLIAGGAKKT